MSVEAPPQKSEVTVAIESHVAPLRVYVDNKEVPVDDSLPFSLTLKAPAVWLETTGRVTLYSVDSTVRVTADEVSENTEQKPTVIRDDMAYLQRIVVAKIRPQQRAYILMPVGCEKHLIVRATGSGSLCVYRIDDFRQADYTGQVVSRLTSS